MDKKLLERERIIMPGGEYGFTGNKLSLINDGKLEIFFVGCGGMFSKTMAQNNIIIIKGDTHIAVDMGNSFHTSLYELTGLEEHDIKCMLPTHSHDDHAGGIGQWALHNKYIGRPFMKKDKIKMIITEAYQEILWDKTLSGSLEWNAQYTLKDGEKRRLNFTDFFDAVRPIWKEGCVRETSVVEYNGIKIELFRTVHIPEQAKDWVDSFISYGLFIDDKILYTSDTKWDSDMLNIYIDKAEHIFHDVQLFNPETVHAPLDTLRDRLKKDIKSKMTLMHLSDDFRKHDITGFVGWAEQGYSYIF